MDRGIAMGDGMGGGLAIADTGAAGYVAEPRDGDEVAARLGLDILCELGSGAPGTAFLLEDGRVLKVTGSVEEAVAAALLHERQAGGGATPGFPRVDDVVAMDTSVELGGVHYALQAYAIVREEAADLDNGWAGGNDWPHWTLAMDLLGRSRMEGKPGVPDLGPAAHCARHAEAVFDAVSWAARELGLAIVDLRTSNIGMAGGGVVLRDFAPETLPVLLLGRGALIPPIPEKPPALGFG